VELSERGIRRGYSLAVFLLANNPVQMSEGDFLAVQGGVRWGRFVFRNIGRFTNFVFSPDSRNLSKKNATSLCLQIVIVIVASRHDIKRRNT